MSLNASDISDIISFSIVCTADSSIITVIDNGVHWIPFIKVQSGQSWSTDVATEIKEIVGFALLPDRVCRIFKIWVPGSNQTNVYNIVVEIKCSAETKRKTKAPVGKYRGRLKWTTENELTRLQMSDNVRSPEIFDFLNLAKNKPGNFHNEFLVCGNFYEISSNVLVTSNVNMHDHIISSADLNVETQKQLLTQFLVICFPALYMSKGSFSRFMLNCGWSKPDIPHLFRAACLSNQSALSFKEFMYFLAALEPKTPHGGLSAEIRCRYIFKFFDQDNDNLLNQQEFRNMVVYMRRSKGQVMDPASVNNDVQNYYKSMGMPADGKPLTMGEFLHAVGDLKLRGTSMIFRSLESVKNFLTKQRSQVGSKMSIDMSRSINIVTRRPMMGNKYDVAIHTIKLQKNGTLINVEQIWQIETAISMSTLKQAGTIGESRKKGSIEVFHQKSVANDVLKTLRTLLMINKGSTNNFVWGTVNVESFANNLIQICKQVKEILKDEPRLVELSSPIYIMGDFHGNFNDLINFEKMFWHLGPNLCPSNLLFLGDYVDRGFFSVEVIMYLFCYKCQAPLKMTLVRGNHEIREIQKMFTFYAECMAKFGERIGTEVWNQVNNAFDCMPLAATVDGKLFCCHGGIPPPWLCPVVSAINNIPVPLVKPDDQSALAWELMWNDPVRSKNLTDALTMELMANEGFANNQRRGTAHVFNIDALEKFLMHNGFSHLIRAHESAQAGFNLQQKGKLLTVFSSSRYCGGNNEAACVLADQGKIRVLRMETT